MGLLVLPAFKVRVDDRAIFIALLVVVVWGAGSSLWSPYRPQDLEGQTAMKLVLQAPLYWAVYAAGRRASGRARVWALRLIAGSMAALALLLIVEAVSGASVYSALRAAIDDPIRPDLAVKNVAQGGFVLAVLAPAAALAWAGPAGNRWAAPLLAAGVLAPGAAFGYDALVMSVLLALSGGAAVLLWPKRGPQAAAGLGAALILAAPLVVWTARQAGWLEALKTAAPLSWAHRLGYWERALGWISAEPFKGWGLDASRAFGPGIQLHPHNIGLQVWMELGVIGAVATALVFGLVFLRQTGRRPSLGAGAATATGFVYLTFASVSFGVWQEWWLALGVLAAAYVAMARREHAVRNGPHRVLPEST